MVTMATSSLASFDTDENSLLTDLPSHIIASAQKHGVEEED
jgi:hypothetical protein